MFSCSHDAVSAHAAKTYAGSVLRVESASLWELYWKLLTVAEEDKVGSGSLSKPQKKRISSHQHKTTSLNPATITDGWYLTACRMNPWGTLLSGKHRWFSVIDARTMLIVINQILWIEIWSSLIFIYLPSHLKQYYLFIKKRSHLLVTFLMLVLWVLMFLYPFLWMLQVLNINILERNI